MKEYRIVRLNARPNWAAVEKAPVEEYPWGGDYRPEAFAQLAYEEGRGFHVRMTCREDAPRAVYTQPDDPVCQDSCLEFFADFAPDSGKGYLNMEANANGTLLLGLGTQRHDRKPVRGMDCPLPQLTAWREGAFWGWQAFVPLSMLQAIYGVSDFAPGTVLRGNFYKCGDKTAQPHYGVWSPVQAPQPDYHRPECFGRLLME